MPDKKEAATREPFRFLSNEELDALSKEGRAQYHQQALAHIRKGHGLRADEPPPEKKN